MNGNSILRPNTPGRDGLSPRTRSLLKAMERHQAKCRKLQEARAALEERVTDALADAAQARAAYFTSLSVDEANVAELERRAKVAAGATPQLADDKTNG